MDPKACYKMWLQEDDPEGHEFLADNYRQWVIRGGFPIKVSKPLKGYISSLSCDGVHVFVTAEGKEFDEEFDYVKKVAASAVEVVD